MKFLGCVSLSVSTFPEGNRQILVFLSPFTSYSVFTHHTPLIETKKLHRSKTRFICWSNFLSVCAEVNDMVCFARPLTINSICTGLWFFSFQSYAGWTSLSPWSLRAKLKSEATETNCFSDSSLESYWPFKSHEWPRQNFSLRYQYNAKQTSNESKGKYELSDS